jgi:hypothetical protein
VSTRRKKFILAVTAAELFALRCVFEEMTDRESEGFELARRAMRQIRKLEKGCIDLPEGKLP